MIEFLAGALTLAYVIAAVYFVHFWQRTADRLFLAFAAAFTLLAVNQLAVFLLGVDDERYNYAYILRVFGFMLILLAILDKNFFGSRKRRP